MLQNTKEIKYHIVEIFDSIDGEGVTAGGLATFIRLAGCNLWCSYCDTPYALSKSYGETCSLSNILSEVKRIGNKHVTLTGGEPLFAEHVNALIDALIDDGYIVNIETNGTIDIEPYVCLEKTIITMDYKTLSSGMNKKMLLDNIAKLRKQDVLKFVCDESDFADIKRILTLYKPAGTIFLSPVYGKINPKKLVEFAKTLRDENINKDVKVQVQLHKIIWDVTERGV